MILATVLVLITCNHHHCVHVPSGRRAPKILSYVLRLPKNRKQRLKKNRCKCSNAAFRLARNLEAVQNSQQKPRKSKISCFSSPTYRTNDLQYRYTGIVVLYEQRKQHKERTVTTY